MNCELQEQRLGLVCASVYSSTTAIRNGARGGTEKSKPPFGLESRPKAK